MRGIISIESENLGRLIQALPLSKLQENSIATVDLDGKHILLARLGDEVYAVEGYCTHEETDLGNGFLIEDRIVCPLHLSQFNLKDGQVMNPPATRPLRKFNVKIEGDIIFVEV